MLTNEKEKTAHMISLLILSICQYFIFNTDKDPSPLINELIQYVPFFANNLNPETIKGVGNFRITMIEIIEIIIKFN